MIHLEDKVFFFPTVNPKALPPTVNPKALPSPVLFFRGNGVLAALHLVRLGQFCAERTSTSTTTVTTDPNATGDDFLDEVHDAGGMGGMVLW